MRSFLLLLAVVAVHGAPGFHGLADTAEAKACRDTLRKGEDRDAMKAAMDTCIGEQAGLADIVKTLIPAPPSGGSGGLPPGPPPAGGPGGPGGRGRRGGHGGPGGIIQQLVAAGNTAAADTLKKCLARTHGHLTTDGAFDVAKFKSDLVAKVTGTAVEANSLLGIDQCPVDTLTNFDVHPYMGCVTAYCATGAAPAAPPA